MSALQRRVCDFLDCDLAHSLGSYGRSAQRLEALRAALQDDAEQVRHHAQYPANWRKGLLDLADLSAKYAARLDRMHDASITPASRPGDNRGMGPHRHPLPPAPLPLRASLRKRGSEKGFREKDPTQRELTWPSYFYEAGLWSIHMKLDESDESLTSDAKRLRQLSEAILQPRARNRIAAHHGDEEASRLAEQRRLRYESRFEDRLLAWQRVASTDPRVHPVSKPISEQPPPPSGEALSRLAEIAGLILDANLGGGGSEDDEGVREPLPLFVLRALVDGHFGLHVATALARRPVGEQLGADDEVAARQVERSIQLLTFVRNAVRAAPHMFAEGPAERDHVLGSRREAWQHVVPARAMWIGTQIGVLALYRRGHAYAVLGRRRKAYNDFHKVQADVRDAQRRLRSTPLHVSGAHEFLLSIDALADFQIGELYRADRQFQKAATHLRRSLTTFERLRDTDGHHDVIANARWLVQLFLSLGKVEYELGRHKSALEYFLRSWRALLELIARDTASELESEPVDAAVEQLQAVVDEPLLYVIDVREFMQPIVEQIEASFIDPRFEALASEILVRVGQVLLVTGVDRKAPGPLPAPRSRLAHRVLRRASSLDPCSTLASAALLRLYALEVLWGADEATDEAATLESKQLREELATQLKRQRKELKKAQWPGGIANDEALARVFELAIIGQLAISSSDADHTQLLARRLLHSFLTHTDSIEARRSLVHRQLMKAPTPCTVQGPSIEFACLRRYSSAFPLVPRAETDRSHGGGYFVRLHGANGAGEDGDVDPVERLVSGIVVDPGTSFVDCFLRSPFALSDIDGIVLTHDHVDHASMLEPLLAVLFEARKLWPDRWNGRRIWVAGNRSIVERLRPLEQYRFKEVADADPDVDAVLYDLSSEHDMKLLSKRLSKRCAPKVKAKLRAISSDTGNRGGGHRDTGGHASLGVEFEVRTKSRKRPRAARLYLASDVPHGAEQADTPHGQAMRTALEADVVVAHLSTVPLSQLRQMSNLGARADGLPEGMGKMVEGLTSSADGLWGKVSQSDKHDTLRKRLEYAYWLEFADADGQARRVRPVEPFAAPASSAEAPIDEWRPWSSHLYLQGLLNWATLASTHGRSSSLFVIGELSEELASFRRRIAQELNDSAAIGGSAAGWKAMTSDIGLRLAIHATGAEDPAHVRVLCSSCELDNDCTPHERWSEPSDIREVCIKGENEGIFYNCVWHDPGQAERGEEAFLERFERYDVFGA